MAGKGMGLLALVPHEPDGDEPMDKGGDAEGGGDEYSPAAKTALAEKFYAAGAEGDFKKAGEALEKFVHLCSME